MVLANDDHDDLMVMMLATRVAAMVCVVMTVQTLTSAAAADGDFIGDSSVSTLLMPLQLNTAT